jgi:hypothetical protein
VTSKAEVPVLARRYLDRALPGGASVPRRLRIGQEGTMRLKPGGRPLRFTAVEEFAVEEVAFSWRARFPILPLVYLRVVDGYAAGAGHLEARLFGLVPVMRARGKEISEGEAYRYLAELPWVPHAILANRRLEWRELDAHAVEVATRVGAARPAVKVEFDAAGDIVGTRCDARPYREGRTSASRPWAGTFGDYAVIGGVRIPTRAEVRWELPDGAFTYWRGTVTSLEIEPVLQ